jgi:hypothetical protein
MNWDAIRDQVMAMGGTDEFRAFMLGIGLGVGVRLIRWGISWLKRVDGPEG